jgi:streptomycin 6-kinase
MEEFKVTGGKLMAKLKELIHEGNVRRIVLKNPEGRTLLDMPLNAGIAGAALLPFWAAVGAVAVLATDYSILVERDPEASTSAAPATKPS